MNYYKATVQYDGTNYFGFQWQKGIPSVQNDINLALEKILPGKMTTVGASRTDTGVHALEQIVKVTTENEIELAGFLVKFNATLPKTIRCLSFGPCEKSFNPIANHLSKEYRYLFTNTLKSNCDDQLYIANHPYELDLELMNKCAAMIIGSHDFHNFCSAGSNVTTSVREIYSCELTVVDPHSVLASDLFPLDPELKNCFQLKIVGKGFLKQMVRHLMTAMWFVGSRKMSVDDFAKLLDGPKKTKRLWKVATPRGLYLYRFNSH